MGTTHNKPLQVIDTVPTVFEGTCKTLTYAVTDVSTVLHTCLRHVPVHVQAFILYICEWHSYDNK